MCLVFQGIPGIVVSATDDSYVLSRARLLIAHKTSSSAVAKRPRDASSASIVSFNSTKRRAQSFIVSYEGYRFITACN